MRMSHTAARWLTLAAQGLLRPSGHPATKADVLATIRRMGALQIDTIQVVARSPYLVLWSRLGDYDPRWLDELLEEGALFEYWAHAACLLPIEDYPLYRRRMLQRSPELSENPRVRAWLDANPGILAGMLAHIRENGPVRSADFVRTDGQRGAWWNWKAEKQALELLFDAGELMIARRHNFQRVYDLRERVLPGWDDARLPPEKEARRALVLKAVRALGITSAAWVGDYFYLGKRDAGALVEALGREGALLRSEVEGWEHPGYVHPENATLAEAAAAGMLDPTLTTLLSPFDPLVSDRGRALSMFGFDYRIECYTPASNRRYGYFTLPILHRGALVGRLDPKAHRKEGRFEVRALYLEPGIAVTEELVREVAAAIRACASWHGTPEVVVRRSEPPELAALLTDATR